LCPLAPLTQTEDPAQLLRQVAAEVDTIGDRRTQGNVAASAAILAGLNHVQVETGSFSYGKTTVLDVAKVEY